LKFDNRSPKLDAYEAVRTKLDIRQFSSRHVDADIKMKILEAARLSQSGNNSQHWRFILIQDPKNLERLAQDSPHGKWVRNADFAIVVLTDPSLRFHSIDAGRVVQSMQLAAWNFEVGSGVFTSIKTAEFRRDFESPPNLEPTIAVAFGYPVGRLRGKKNRKPLAELAFLEKYGHPIDTKLLEDSKERS
jgi:nitroreductase